MKYDFCGWATKNNLKCSDGKVIRRNAFAVNDGQKVPLVWNHQYDGPSKVLGHALLKNLKDGIFAYCNFNNTQAGKDAKEAVKHGDVCSLSIFANNLETVGNEVRHGVIREVSLVLAGANPGAFIESVLAHGMPMDDTEDEAIIYTGSDISLQVSEPNTYVSHALEDEDGEESELNEDSSPLEIYEAMSPLQKDTVAVILGYALEGEEEEDEGDDETDDGGEEGGEDMRHSVFEGGIVDQSATSLTHDDMKTIFDNAKQVGSLKAAVTNFLGDDEVLIHAATIDTTGMTVHTGKQTYGFNDADMLMPDYKPLNGGAPEFISRNQEWVGKVLSAVHRTPFTKVKSTYANITEDEARAKGYIKGKQKKEEVFTILKRKTDATTIYKKQKIDRDDIIDIADFDVVAWIRVEMDMMLDEEKARAILIGDGRMTDSEDKIDEGCIRPVVKDVPLFNTKWKIKQQSTMRDTAKLLIDDLIRSRKKYKGSGNPTFFTTEDWLTEMLLLEDNNGHKIYKSEAEVATAIRAKEIVTVEPMEGATVDGYDLIGTLVNLTDYNVGANKGSDKSPLFEQFDIDFNQQKYLLEGRMSGALVKPFSAVTFLLEETKGADDTPTYPQIPDEGDEGDDK